jgi:tRNA1Val (adenine37-N6)-methyltransferase
VAPHFANDVPQGLRTAGIRDPRSFFNGNIVLNQPGPVTGFPSMRLSSPIWSVRKPGETMLDLGTGCGVIPIMLAFRHPEIRVIGVEIQPALSRSCPTECGRQPDGPPDSPIEKDMGQLSLADIGGPVERVV